MCSSKDLRVLSDVVVVDGSPSLPKHPTHWTDFAQAVFYEMFIEGKEGDPDDLMAVPNVKPPCHLSVCRQEDVTHVVQSAMLLHAIHLHHHMVNVAVLQALRQQSFSHWKHCSGEDGFIVAGDYVHLTMVADIFTNGNLVLHRNFGVHLKATMSDRHVPRQVLVVLWCVGEHNGYRRI